MVMGSLLETRRSRESFLEGSERGAGIVKAEAGEGKPSMTQPGYEARSLVMGELFEVRDDYRRRM